MHLLAAMAMATVTAKGLQSLDATQFESADLDPPRLAASDKTPTDDCQSLFAGAPEWLHDRFRARRPLSFPAGNCGPTAPGKETAARQPAGPHDVGQPRQTFAATPACERSSYLDTLPSSRCTPRQRPAEGPVWLTCSIFGGPARARAGTTMCLRRGIWTG